MPWWTPRNRLWTLVLDVAAILALTSSSSLMPRWHKGALHVGVAYRSYLIDTAPGYLTPARAVLEEGGGAVFAAARGTCRVEASLLVLLGRCQRRVGSPRV